MVTSHHPDARSTDEAGDGTAKVKRRGPAGMGARPARDMIVARRPSPVGWYDGLGRASIRGGQAAAVALHSTLEAHARRRKGASHWPALGPPVGQQAGVHRQARPTQAKVIPAPAAPQSAAWRAQPGPRRRSSPPPTPWPGLPPRNKYGRLGMLLAPSWPRRPTPALPRIAHLGQNGQTGQCHAPHPPCGRPASAHRLVPRFHATPPISNTTATT
ncbi:uncharacterized protein PSFLO_07532 [Pseudozyma flocculosa]|uniref:Uncharacterized protein n=1 Tax=Pseudozyma flocculosa TaxID=84751 RepID=A0A5C3FF86_9BASI|nr:uncharacterized protein PSFLO_07532 [Pseudozyma flocculosa]